jgi:glycosyltransferase involved in cell wall biosynthesis
MRTLVSILIPCHNAEQWVAEAIRSALAQRWPEKEVLVVDDGSTDQSLQLIRSFQDQIRWETGPNRGGNVARNRLLQLARGEWLQYLDADDYLLPEKIEGQMKFIAANPKQDVVYGPMIREHWSHGESRSERCPIPKPHDPWILLSRCLLPQTGAHLWRKQAIIDVGGWRADQTCFQDYELHLRLMMAGKRFGYCEQGGAVYRQWGEHTVSKRDKREMRQRRLEIQQRTEDFLRQQNQLTHERRWAINQCRFEIARIAWQCGHNEALAIMRLIRKSQPGFIPAGVAAPKAYRIIFRTLGFRVAETIADLRRNFLRVPQT